MARPAKSFVRLTSRVGLLAVVLAAATAPTSQAATNFEFSPALTLSESETPAAFPQVAVDAQGRATTVWQALSPDGHYRLVQALRMRADGTTEPLQTLISMSNARSNQPTHGWCPCPQVGVDSHGRATVVWQSSSPTDFRIQAVRLGANGVPGTVHTLSEAGRKAYDHQLAIDTTDRVTVAWSVTSSVADGVQSVRLDADGTPEPIQTLSAPDANASGPDVAVDSQDRATVVWGANEGIQAVRLSAAGVPGPVQTVSPAGEVAALSQVVIDSQGRATIAWWRFGGTYQAKAIRLDADGVPGSVLTLTSETQEALNPQIAIDPQDRVTATWEDFTQHVLAVRLDADGTPGPVRQLSDSDRRAGHPHLGAGPDGQVVVVWTHPPVFSVLSDSCASGRDPASDVVQAAFINPDGTLGPVTAASATGKRSGEAQVALDPTGHPIVVWHDFDGPDVCSQSIMRVQLSRSGPVVPTPTSLPAATTDPPVVVPESGPPEPFSPTPTPPKAGALLLGKEAAIRGRRVVVKAACVGDHQTICEGTIRLVARIAVKRARVTRNVLVAAGTYHLGGGQRRTLTLTATKLGRRLAGGTPRRKVRVQAQGRGVRGSTVLLTTPQKCPKPGASRPRPC